MFLTVALEKTLESPSDSKEIKPVHPKRNQSWIFIRRTDAETEASVLWPRDVKSWLIRKYPDTGKDWRQEEKGTTEDEMVGWHHWLNGHGFEQALGVGDLQGSLACCTPWGQEELDMTEQLNNHNIKKWDQEEVILLNVKTGGKSSASDEGKKQNKNQQQKTVVRNYP